MRRPELDAILTTMLDSQPEVSDLLFTADKPLQVESFGELKPVACDPPIEKLTPFQTEMVALNLMGDNLWHLGDLLRRGSCDTAYTLADKARFRISIFSQRGNYSIVLRKLNTVIPTLEWLNFPEVIKQIPREKTGLVLVTGATGSGKSTTLAAILNEISHTRPVHIITLEDPIEFVHPHGLATFNQRELGSDFDTFSTGLRAALRQAPKVILVGEMRDRETIQIALSAAETGHLVLSTLHTVDAGQTINRILGMFETEEQEQLRARLADTLRWVVSQRLVPKVGGGRFPCSKSWAPTCACRKAFAWVKPKARASTRSRRRASPSGGARSTIPPSKPTSRTRSRRKPPCSTAPSAGQSHAGSTISRRPGANRPITCTPCG